MASPFGSFELLVGRLPLLGGGLGAVLVEGVEELRLPLVEPVVELGRLLLVLGLLGRKETPEGDSESVMVSRAGLLK